MCLICIMFMNYNGNKLSILNTKFSEQAVHIFFFFFFFFFYFFTHIFFIWLYFFFFFFFAVV
jgi:hypothetical protein